MAKPIPPPLLQADALQVRIGDLLLCDRLDLSLQPGQCWGLLGCNGAGKTTLLHTLAGLLPAAAGHIRLLGTDLRTLPRRRIARSLGLLLQDQEARFPITVLERALAGRYPHLGPWDWPDEADRRGALAVLERLGLTGLAQRNVQTLSGGERQRVALATLLSQAPRVMLLDEPVSHLDLHEQLRVLGILQQLAETGHALLMSLHDPNLALRYCDHLLLLDGGHAVCGPKSQIGDAETLSRLYAQPLTVLEGPHGPVMVPR